MKLAPAQIFMDGRLVPAMIVEIENGCITDVREKRPNDEDAKPLPLLTPALVDLQVNGGGGVLFNQEPNPEGVAAIIDAHRGLGTGWLLPTVITDHPETIDAAADAIIDTKNMAGVLGIHIEGPHINPARKGTHDPARIRPFDDHTRATLKRLRGADIPVMLTVAPELMDQHTIREISDMGVILSGGHSNANYTETVNAIDAGLSAFTHLYNAMPQMSSRDPGMIAAAIRSDMYCGIIADGIHVDYNMLRIAYDARAARDRMFIVSDAMPTVGGPDEFDLFHFKIRVDNGRLVNSEGSLAGAHIDMLTSLQNLVHKAGIPPEEALRMAITIPLETMRLPDIDLVGRNAGEWLALDENLKRIPL